MWLGFPLLWKLFCFCTQGIRRLAGDLPNLIGSIQVDYPKFSHIDFLFAKDADKLIYRQILDILVSGAWN